MAARRAAHFVALAIALVAGAACDGDGGGGSPTDPGTPSGRSFFFEATAPPLPNSLILRGAPQFRASQVTLDLIATDVDEVHDLILAFVYPPDLVTLRSVVVEEAAPPGGQGVELPIVPESPGVSGRFTFSIPGDDGAGFTGDGLLLRFVFDYRQESGNGAVLFTEGAVFDALGQPVPMTYIGGTLVVD